MDLAARRSSRRKETLVMRLGCFLVSFAVVASLVLEPPRARAFAATSAAVSALAGGFLNACGLAPVVSGMSSSEEVNKSVARLIQDFLTEEFSSWGVPTPEEWLGQNLALTVSGGKIFIPKPVAAKLGQFATWVASKYAMKADGAVNTGVNVVFSDQSITFADGSTYNFSYALNPSWDGTEMSLNFSECVFGTPISFGDSKDNPFSIKVSENFEMSFYRRFSTTIGGQEFFDTYVRRSRPGSLGNFGILARISDSGLITFFLWPDNYVTYAFISSSSSSSIQVYSRLSYSAIPLDVIEDLLSVSDLSLNVSGTMQEILDRLTALEDGQSIALDVGAAQSMELQEILQGILEGILTGDLAASAEIVAAAEVPVDPPAETLPDVDGLGLPALGAALTSRFPFSIPWDVYRGVTLLAAPPKAPYFEVDFMAPLADRVGGWKGSTKIVLDFSEYEIIGQVCRWTSTIGFCLMLAGGTKRLIWTA